jgi:hypothetical protein
LSCLEDPVPSAVGLLTARSATARDHRVILEAEMEITSKDKFWMNFKLYQLWRFIVLNINILKAVDHSKRS